jgi:hypothetical protein
MTRPSQITAEQRHAIEDRDATARAALKPLAEEVRQFAGDMRALNKDLRRYRAARASEATR